MKSRPVASRNLEGERGDQAGSASGGAIKVFSAVVLADQPGSTADGVALVSTTAELYQAFADPSTDTIVVQGNLFLTAEVWPKHIDLARNATLTGGSNPAFRPVIDLGGMDATLSLLPGARLLLHNIGLTNPKSQLDVQLADKAWILPHNPNNLLWPTWSQGANAEVEYRDMYMVIPLPHHGYTCQSFVQGLQGLVAQWGHQAEVADDSYTLVLRQYFERWEPVVDGHAEVGHCLQIFNNMNASCVEPADAPATATPAAATDAAAPQPQSQQKAGLIAGLVVGGLALCSIAVVLALFIQSRLLKHRYKKWDESTQVDLPAVTSASAQKATSFVDISALQQQLRAMDDSWSASEHLSKSAEQHRQEVGNVCFDWRIQPSQLKICTTPDGRDHLLGRGAFGVVYLGVLDSIQTVAVKMLHMKNSSQLDTAALQRFEGELTVLRSARHRNIVVCYGGILDEEYAYLVEEYCAGGDLYTAIGGDSQLECRRLDWYHGGCAVAIDVAHGLQYLHQNNIMHNDIKSSNILLAADGTAKIADAGLAHVLCSHTHLSASDMRGTYDWVCPEMLQDRTCSPKSDVWSLGIVLWEIVTGERPKRGCNRPVRCPQECPTAIAELIGRCLSIAPEERPTVRQVVQDLMAAPAPPQDQAVGPAA